MKQLIKSLSADYADIHFISGEVFSWSPSDRKIYYNGNVKSTEISKWSLLHEFSHAALNHTGYSSDLELLMMEAEAWDYAKSISPEYGLKIDDEHVQDCLDTYRDWLHARSGCPTCDQTSMQVVPQVYLCVNCQQQWRVSDAKFRRPYRLCIKSDKNKTSVEHSTLPMFY
jgi:hypothetical protein